MPAYNRRDEMVGAMTLALLIHIESTNGVPPDIIPGAVWALMSKVRRLSSLAEKGDNGNAWAIAARDAEAIAREMGVVLTIARDGDQARVCVLTPKTGRYNTAGGPTAGWAF